MLDSSIIAAIFFSEKSSSKAAHKVENSELVTVDLARAEVANVAWKRIKLFDQDQEVITHALKMSMDFIETSCEVIPTRELVDDSYQIALKENISFYDSLFLAASQLENITLLTRDKRLKKNFQNGRNIITPTSIFSKKC